MSVYLINGIQHYINVSLEDLPCRRRKPEPAQNLQPFFPTPAAPLQPGLIQSNPSGIAPPAHLQAATPAQPYLAHLNPPFGNQSYRNNNFSHHHAPAQLFAASGMPEPTSAHWPVDASLAQPMRTNRHQQFPSPSGYDYELSQTQPFGSIVSAVQLGSSYSETDTASDYGTDDGSDNMMESYVPEGYFDQPQPLWCETHAAPSSSSRSSSFSYASEPSDMIPEWMSVSFDRSTRRHSETSCQTPFSDNHQAAYGGFRSSLDPFSDHNLSSQSIH